MRLLLRRSLSAAAAASCRPGRGLSPAVSRPPWAMIYDTEEMVRSPELRASFQLAEPTRASHLRVPEHLIDPWPRPDPNGDILPLVGGGVLAASGDGLLLLDFMDARATALVVAKLGTAQARQLMGLNMDPNKTRFVYNPLSGQLFGSAVLAAAGTTYVVPRGVQEAGEEEDAAARGVVVVAVVPRRGGHGDAGAAAGVAAAASAAARVRGVHTPGALAPHRRLRGGGQDRERQHRVRVPRQAPRRARGRHQARLRRHRRRQRFDAERAFWAELRLLSRVNQRNLVQLLGFCEERGERILVFEFMPHGTLHDHLHGGTGAEFPLFESWEARLSNSLLLELVTGREAIHRTSSQNGGSGSPRIVNEFAVLAVETGSGSIAKFASLLCLLLLDPCFTSV